MRQNASGSARKTEQGRLVSVISKVVKIAGDSIAAEMLRKRKDAVSCALLGEMMLHTAYKLLRYYRDWG
jgi:hypothetical protein